jgi:hypothetical protein
MQAGRIVLFRGNFRFPRVEDRLRAGKAACQLDTTPHLAEPAQGKKGSTRMLSNYLLSFGVEKGHFIEVELDGHLFAQMK